MYYITESPYYMPETNNVVKQLYANKFFKTEIKCKTTILSTRKDGIILNA